jgi:hypothetical protein
MVPPLAITMATAAAVEIFGAENDRRVRARPRHACAKSKVVGPSEKGNKGN